MLKRLLEKLFSMEMFKHKEQPLDDFYKQNLPKSILTLLGRQTFKFDVAHAILMERFHVTPTLCRSFKMVTKYVNKEPMPDTEFIKIEQLLQSKNARRDALNFMVELKDITPYMINQYYPVGEKRNELNQWLDGTIVHLS